MIVYVIYDDYNAYLGNGAPKGIYSTRAKAVDAIREMPSRVLPLDIAEFEVDAQAIDELGRILHEND